MTTWSSPRARRTAIRLLQLYPRPWRRRYEREMRALLEEMPVNWRQVANLAGTGIREWLSPRAFGWPARTAAGRLIFIRTLTFMACAYALDGVSRVVAAIVAPGRIELPEWFVNAAAMLGLVFAVRVLFEVAVRMSTKPWAAKIRRQRGAWSQLSDLEIMGWALLLLPRMFVEHAQVLPDYLGPTMLAAKPYVHVIQIFVWTQLAIASSRRSLRLQRIQFSAAKHRPVLERPVLNLK